MIKLFIDTNVVLDTIEHNRTPDWAASEETMDLAGESEYFKLCLSMKSIADISYVGGKMEGKDKIKTMLRNIWRDIIILPLDDMALYDALESTCPDFEDALQISCAESGDCNYIVTRNKKHFGAYTDIPVYTPKEFIAKLKAASTTPSTSCI